MIRRTECGSEEHGSDAGYKNSPLHEKWSDTTVGVGVGGVLICRLLDHEYIFETGGEGFETSLPRNPTPLNRL